MEARLEKVYVVFKTHFDIGFTGWVSDVVQRYRTDMLKDVIEICTKTKDNGPNEKYVWTMSAWPLLQSLQGSHTAEQEAAEPYLHNGQLIWHMLPYTTHTEFCGLEEWIRGMYVSRSLSERYGYRPRDAKMTDVPGHTWMVPSLLKKAGVNILHLGCNGASTPPDVPPVFFWEGPDGERLLTFYSKGGYGTGILPPEEWTHPVWLAMIQTSDNHGPHEATVIEEMKAAIAESGQNAELHIGSLADFADDFLARNPDLPVIRGDLADSWIHGVGTAPREVARVRELRGRIAAAESALSLSLLVDGPGEVSEAQAQQIKQLLDKSYEHTLLFGEHTWGMDCKTFLFPRTYDKKSFLRDKTSERYLRMEHSWQEQIDYLNTAEQALDQAVQLLAGVSSAADSKVNAWRVYNHLGWSRDAVIELSSEHAPAAGETFIDASSGQELVWSVSGESVQVTVKDLPALGYKTIVCLQPAEPPAPDQSLVEVAAAASADPSASSLSGRLEPEEAVLENAFLLIRADRRTGWLTSVYDKRLGKEWVDQTAPYGFGQYQYDVYSSEDITQFIKKYAYRFYDWGVHDYGKTEYPEQQKRVSFSTQLADMRLIEEPGLLRLECRSVSAPESYERYGNAAETVWSLTLTEEAPFFDMEWTLNGKEETPLAESGHLMFPLNAAEPSYRLNKMGTVLDPASDIIRSSNTLLYCVESFADVAEQDGTAGMAIIPLDTPLLSIGRSGMWDFEHDYKPAEPELRFNLFNNWWGTNFPQWMGGRFVYRYRFVPHQGDWREGAIWKTAQETVTPVAAVAYQAEGHSSAYADLLPLGLDGMAVTCFKPAEDGDGFILRLRDWTGMPREVSVGLAARVKEALKADLLEYNTVALDLSPIPDGDGRLKQLRFQTAAFEVHTLRIR